MVSPDYVSGRCQRLRLVKHRVSNGHGQISHGIAVYHIAKINQSNNALVAGVEIAASAHDHVVVIGIVVNGAPTQSRQ